MSIFELIAAAMHGQDPDNYLGLLHDDSQFSGISPEPHWTPIWSAPLSLDRIRRRF